MTTWNKHQQHAIGPSITKPRRAFKKKEKPLKTTEIKADDIIFRMPSLSVGFEYAMVESVTCTTNQVKIKAFNLSERKSFKRNYFNGTEGKGTYQWKRASDMTDMMQILKDVEQFVLYGEIDILKYVDYENNGTNPITHKRRLERINNIIATTRFVGNGKAVIINDHPETAILTGQFWHARANSSDDALAYGQTRVDVQSFNMICKWARYIEGERYYLVSEKAVCLPKHVDHYLKFFYNA